MKLRHRQLVGIGAVTMLIFFTFIWSFSVLSAFGADATKSNGRYEIRAIGDDIAQGIGEVRKVNTSGQQGNIFIFEEYHNSRVGQLQIATMLLRLHDRYRLKRIGLEGALQSPRPLDGAWFHNAGGPETRG